MALKRIQIGGKPPSIGQRNNLLHTVVLQGIAVFFCSTQFSLFFLYIPITVNLLLQSVSTIRWVRFFLVGKGCFLSDKHFWFDERGQAVILTEWQTFIAKYP